MRKVFGRMAENRLLKKSDKEVMNCYIYGIGMQYNILSSHLKAYQDKIKVLGLVTTEPQKITYLDGKRVIRPWDMKVDEMDYVIVAMKQYKEVFEILKKMGLSGRILRSDIFSIPNFVLEDYLRLKESRPTILANTCLAGLVYHELGLEMLSPTINVRCRNYITFLKNYEHYLSMDIMLAGKDFAEEDLYKDEPVFSPKGIFGDSVCWQFPHVDNEKEGIETWNRRRHSVNFDNIIALMIVLTDEEAYEFEQLPIKRKLGFYYKDLKLSSVLYTSEWDDTVLQNRCQFRYQNFIHVFYKGSIESICKIDWIKFLNGETEFLRF